MTITSYNLSKYPGTVFHHSLTEEPDAKQFERHCHSGYELIYVSRGKGKYIVESAEYPLLPNTVLLLRPYEYHYVCPQKDCAYERYVIHFSEKLLLDIAESLDLINPQKTGSFGVYFSEDAVDQNVRAQFKVLSHVLSMQDGQSTGASSRHEAIVTTMVNQILILLSYLQAHTPTQTENELVANVIQYLGEHLADDVSLEEMARHFFVSKYHLCHAFHAHTGTSVFSYLTTKRIALAQQHLEEGMPAIRVAESVGFRDYSVFYRAYKKITGESPSRAKGIVKREKTSLPANGD